MAVGYPRVLPLGDAGVTVEFGEGIDPLINDRALAFAEAVQASALPGVTEVVPTYQAVAVYFDPRRLQGHRLAAKLESLARESPGTRTHSGRLLTVPVVYGGDYGPDLETVGELTGLSAAAVILLHTKEPYRVFMLGFSPGFPYLGPVPPALAVARLAEPRASVPAGSVGLADGQTGIYPSDSPGGWRLIGRTPLALVDWARSDPFRLHPGDGVQFVPITSDEFARFTPDGVAWR